MIVVVGGEEWRSSAEKGTEGGSSGLAVYGLREVGDILVFFFLMV